MFNFNLVKNLFVSLLFFLILSSSNIALKTNNHSVASAKQLLENAEAARISGQFQESIDLYTEYLNTYKTSISKEEECQILLRLGLLYWNIGKLSDFVGYFRSAQSITETIIYEKQKKEIETALTIHDLYQESKTHRSNGDYPEACRSLENAIDLARSIKSKELELKCLRMLGVTYLYASDYQKLRQKTEEALTIARSVNHKTSEGRCLNNLGIYYEKIGNYSRALDRYTEALNIFRELNSSNEISNCLNNLGICYQSLGNYDKSLEYFQQCLEIDKEIGDKDDLSRVLNNIGENYRLKGLISQKEEDFTHALDYFTRCLETATNIEFTSSQVHALNNIGSIYTDMRKYGEALTYFHSALELAQETNDIESQGMVLNNIGIVHHNQGNYEDSSEYFQKAIDLAMGIKHGKILWEAFYEMGKNYTKQGDYYKALERYKASITVIEDIRSNIVLEELKASFFGTDKRLGVYHNLINLLVFLNENDPQKGYNREAFNYLERAKARSFLDRLERSRIDIKTGLDVQLQNREKELMKNISNIYTHLLDNGISSEDKKNFEASLMQYEDELEALKREMRSKSPAYASLKYPEIITIEEAQNKLLDNNTAFFAYMIGVEHSLAFVVTKKKLKIFRLQAREKLQSSVSSYLKVISDKDNHNFKMGNELFHQLVLPGLERNIKNIIFVPADVLNALPFETLITDKNHWLIEDIKISYAPSITSLREIISRNGSNHIRRQKDILAVGDPNFGELEKENTNKNIFNEFYAQSDLQFFRLKYSGIETDRISSLFSKEKSDILKRKQATEERIKQYNLIDYKILHFATHSLIDDKMPARSSIMLVLDNDPTEDGFLQMREIYNLKLNADLVTLSACHTGGGQLIMGEGIEGLNRAFFYAGTSSVIMSLWSVNDQATYQLMERFYTHLRSSRTIAQALQQAKLEMIHSEVLTHPYYWAGFIVSGNSTKVIFINPVRKYIALILSFILLGSILTIVLRKKNSNNH
jgi:tetratricopeptide (TPR) repeat protein/CHAT domain-containing protein